MAEIIERQSSFDGERIDRREIHQFLAGSTLIQAGPGSVVVHGSNVTGNVVAARDAVDRGDDISAVEALKRLGLGGLRLAREVGADVAAAVIAAVLGVR